MYILFLLNHLREVAEIMTLYSQKCVPSKNKTSLTQQNAITKLGKNLIYYCNLYSDFPNYLFKQLFFFPPTN